MNIESLQRYSVTAIASLAISTILFAIAFAAADKSANTAVTQCFREKSMPPCEEWKSGQEYCRFFRKTFYLDEARGCYGQRWSIPKGFYSRKYVAYHPVTETLILTVGRPGLVSDITALTPGRELPKRVPSLYKEVKVWALFAGDFKKRVSEVTRVYEETGGLADTKRQLYGLRIFDQFNTPADQYRDVFLFPTGDTQWYAKCAIKPGLTLEQDLKTPGGCAVAHNIDDRVYVEYFVKNEELANLNRINAEMTNLIRGFMAN